MEPPLILTREQVRRVDDIVVHQFGMSSLVLMENAGRGVVDVLLEIDPSLTPTRAGASGGRGRTVAILCGKGNNAGDGFVIARHLEIRGVLAKVLLLGSPEELRGDARENYEILSHADVPIIDLSAMPPVAGLDEHARSNSWLIDAMLGTGAQGEPRAPFDAAIEWLNAQDARRLAVDIPSGLDCDSGVPASATVRAEITCTFVAMKPGFMLPQAAPFLGQVHVLSIGVPPRLVRAAAAV
jgi:NAD(P)H-hydrate epimerase